MNFVTKCGCGGMADAADSKSATCECVRVRVPPSALDARVPEVLIHKASGTFLFVIINIIYQIE